MEQPPSQLFASKPPRNPVTLFDGTTCRGCALIVKTLYNGPGSCWGASEHIDREIVSIGLDELLPDGSFESDGLHHDFAVVTFTFHRDSDEDMEFRPDRWIPVTAEQALAHLRQEAVLWTEIDHG
tara:strand:+ start:2423 stop:2797 length:375 start_codon:yes stop_codon:yes gene_type:complete